VAESFIQLSSLGFCNDQDHILEQDLESHGMSTAFMGNKEFTVALECAVVETDVMFVVVAMKGHIELVETEPLSVFRVTFCLLKLADHSIVHTLSPFHFEILLLEMKPGFPVRVFELQTHFGPVSFRGSLQQKARASARAFQ
jgi:hypothetical protein